MILVNFNIFLYILDKIRANRFWSDLAAFRGIYFSFRIYGQSNYNRINYRCRDRYRDI
jgi:hypothetical protein